MRQRKPLVTHKIVKERDRLKKALTDISKIGTGIPSHMVDYQNCLKNARRVAHSALHPDVCPTCGRLNET